MLVNMISFDPIPLVVSVLGTLTLTVLLKIVIPIETMAAYRLASSSGNLLGLVLQLAPIGTLLAICVGLNRWCFFTLEKREIHRRK